MSPPTSSSSRLTPQLLQALLIIAAGYWIYAPALNGGWLWDDNAEITANPLMNDPAWLWKLWTQPANQNGYFPLTYTVQRMEWNLWGLNPLGYHVVNVALHLISSLLVWRLLDKIGLRLAWLGGLLFCLHPVQVESVAWISELKNALSMPPFLLAMCCWIDYDRLGKRRDYCLALGLFLIAVLCKTTVVMFPVTLLLYAWWRRGRVGWADLKLSAPFFAVSAAIGLITILGGIWDHIFNHLGPEIGPEGGVAGRLVLVGSEIAFYFSKSMLPVGLLPVYPRWNVDPASLLQYLPWVVLFGVLGWLWTKRQSRGRHALLGLGFFLINLTPCPGFIPAPNMGYAWVMDHFLYVPIIGLIGLFVAGVEGLGATLPKFVRPLGIGIMTIILTLLAWESRAYATKFGDAEAYWAQAFRGNPNSWMTRTGYGETLALRGRIAEALGLFESAVQLNPAFPNAQRDLAKALLQTGRFAEAIDHYKEVVKLDPKDANASYELGNALVLAHRMPEAASQFERALELDPRNYAAHYAMGGLLYGEHRVPEAIKQFQESVQLDPNHAEVHYALGNALLATNDVGAALEQYQEAVRLDPMDAKARSNLGVTLARMNRIPEAIGEFQAALRIDPNFVAAKANLARAQGRGKTQGAAPASQ